jgi:hypothetical protein
VPHPLHSFPLLRLGPSSYGLYLRLVYYVALPLRWGDVDSDEHMLGWDSVVATCSKGYRHNVVVRSSAPRELLLPTPEWPTCHILLLVSICCLVGVG